MDHYHINILWKKDVPVPGKTFTKTSKYFSKAAKVIATPENILAVPDNSFFTIICASGEQSKN